MLILFFFCSCHCISGTSGPYNSSPCVADCIITIIHLYVYNIMLWHFSGNSLNCVQYLEQTQKVNSLNIILILLYRNMDFAFVYQTRYRKLCCILINTTIISTTIKTNVNPFSMLCTSITINFNPLCIQITLHLSFNSTESSQSSQLVKNIV